jgi:hypothetical protein
MAGTTGSTGLNNAFADTQQVQTTLPSWYDQAQQNVISQAGTALGQAPAFQNTTAQGAVNTLTGPANPYTQGQTALNTIASGAANPWITSPTGQVTPNTSTPLGGLFSAENAQLNQLLPNYTAGANAAGIGSGQFGSLRDITGVSKAKADAQANLFAQQMTAALQNQSTGSTAGVGLGTLGTGAIKSGLDVGAAQMNAPFIAPGNYANMINAVSAPATVSQQNQMSPLSMLGALSNVPNAGTNLIDSIFGRPAQGTQGVSGYIPGTTGLLGSLQRAAPSIFGQAPVAGTGAGGGPGLGQIKGSDGKIYTDPSYGTGATGPQPVNEPAPPEALNPDGSYNPNSGWTQDQSGSWYNTSSSTPPVETPIGNLPIQPENLPVDTGNIDSENISSILF